MSICGSNFILTQGNIHNALSYSLRKTIFKLIKSWSMYCLAWNGKHVILGFVWWITDTIPMLWFRTFIIPLALALCLENTHPCFQHQGSSLHIAKLKSTRLVVTQWSQWHKGQNMDNVLTYDGQWFYIYLLDYFIREGKYFPEPLHWVWWSHWPEFE